MQMDLLQQRARFDPERIRQPVDVVQADVPLATLDAAHVGAVKFRSMGERLLRKPALAPKLADTVTEADATFALLIGDWHFSTVAGW